MHFHDFELAWRVFTLEEATGWHWPPSVLIHEDGPLMDDLTKIRSIAGLIEFQLFPPKKN